MKKKMLIFLTVLLLVCVGCEKKEEPPKEIVRIKDLEKYKELEKEEIEYIEIIRYTEGGITNETLNEREEIERTYNNLKTLRVLEKVNMACEDNTIIYNFHTTLHKYTLEFECEWLVLDGDRYAIEK